jgi:hypothetical protein
MGVQIAILGRLVRPGMRFQHRRWWVPAPDGSVRPAVCTVTAIRRGIVYYEDDSGQAVGQYPSDFVYDVDRWLELAA